MSISPGKHSNPTTPLSPFPSTPNRLIHLQTINPYHNNSTATTSSTTSPTDHHNTNHTHYPFTLTSPTTSHSLAEHVSPTKAAATTRLNHEITTLTTWLEGLLCTDTATSPTIPPPLLKWQSEVLNAAHASHDGPVPILGSLNHALSFGSIHTNLHPSNPTRPPHRSNTSNAPVSTPTEPLDTLKSLKQTNLSSNHLHSLLHHARQEALVAIHTHQAQLEHQRTDNIPARILLDEIHASLTPHATEALQSLAGAAVSLGIELNADGTGTDGIDDNDGDDDGTANYLTTLYARAILRQLDQKLTLERQVHDLELLQQRITRVSTSTDNTQQDNHHHDGDHDHDHDQQDHIHTQTTAYNRDTKHLNLKIMEYQDRVTSLERQLVSLRAESISLEDILNARARVEERRARVKALQERFAAFNGLPSDLEESRSEVRRAMVELEGLKRRREGLFERMGTG